MAAHPTVQLGAGALAALHRLEHVAEIGSTSAELVARARAGETGPLWLVSDVQTSGRGRSSRNWASPGGNLYASLLLTDPAPATHIAELSFVFSLALRDAVLAAAHLYDDAALALKWPNDLMVEGQKTAGLLLEGGQVAGTSFVVAGFGVNIVSHPDGTTHRATHLAAAGHILDRDSLLVALAHSVASRLAQWDRGAGFARLRTSWLTYAYGRGEQMRVNTLAESFEGVFETIDAGGRLVVKTPEGERIISAGEVFALGAVV
ncbi:MAG: biotin--[acetyl-CoA-carboxylase] ligase [Hyphomicrobiales bacterium]|nr:biotin--[acetyl-CoA-carboxylase] ligase [Hyphomicrobiales bacterium]